MEISVNKTVEELKLKLYEARYEAEKYRAMYARVLSGADDLTIEARIIVTNKFDWESEHWEKNLAGIR